MAFPLAMLNFGGFVSVLAFFGVVARKHDVHTSNELSGEYRHALGDSRANVLNHMA